MSESPAKRFGLPENLAPEDVATALEDAAAQIRKGGSHDAWLIEAINAHQDKKREGEQDVSRALMGER